MVHTTALSGAGHMVVISNNNGILLLRNLLLVHYIFFKRYLSVPLTMPTTTDE